MAATIARKKLCHLVERGKEECQNADWDRAASSLSEAFKVLKNHAQLPGPPLATPLEAAKLLSNLSLAQYKLGRYEEAEKAARSALLALGEDVGRYPKALYRLGAALDALHRKVDSLVEFVKLRCILGARDPDTTKQISALCSALRAQEVSIALLRLLKKPELLRPSPPGGSPTLPASTGPDPSLDTAFIPTPLLRRALSKWAAREPGHRPSPNAVPNPTGLLSISDEGPRVKLARWCLGGYRDGDGVILSTIAVQYVLDRNEDGIKLLGGVQRALAAAWIAAHSQATAGKAAASLTAAQKEAEPSFVLAKSGWRWSSVQPDPIDVVASLCYVAGSVLLQGPQGVIAPRAPVAVWYLSLSLRLDPYSERAAETMSSALHCAQQAYLLMEGAEHRPEDTYAPYLDLPLDLFLSDTAAFARQSGLLLPPGVSGGSEGSGLQSLLPSGILGMQGGGAGAEAKGGRGISREGLDEEKPESEQWGQGGGAEVFYAVATIPKVSLNRLGAAGRNAVRRLLSDTVGVPVSAVTLEGAKEWAGPIGADGTSQLTLMVRGATMPSNSDPLAATITVSDQPRPLSFTFSAALAPLAPPPPSILGALTGTSGALQVSDAAPKVTGPSLTVLSAAAQSLALSALAITTEPLEDLDGCGATGQAGQEKGSDASGTHLAKAPQPDSSSTSDSLVSTSGLRVMAPLKPNARLVVSRPYVFVGSDGRPLDLEDRGGPFGLTRAYYKPNEAEDHTWIELLDGTCRWCQSAGEVTVKVLRVPRRARAADLEVDISVMSLSVALKAPNQNQNQNQNQSMTSQAAAPAPSSGFGTDGGGSIGEAPAPASPPAAGRVLLSGDLLKPIDPAASTWTLDPKEGLTIVMKKLNLDAYENPANYLACFWDRLLTHHDEVDIHLIDKDYSDLPPPSMLHYVKGLEKMKLEEEERKAKEAAEAAEAADGEPGAAGSGVGVGDPVGKKEGARAGSMRTTTGSEEKEVSGKVPRFLGRNVAEMMGPGAAARDTGLDGGKIGGHPVTGAATSVSVAPVDQGQGQGKRVRGSGWDLQDQPPATSTGAAAAAAPRDLDALD